MSGLSRRALLKGVAKGVAATGVLGLVGVGATEVSYRVRQAGWQRAGRARLVLRGSVVTFDRSRPALDDGAVYIDEHGVIEAVAAAADPIPSAYAGAATVETGGVMYPGLIDLHNHPYFDLRSLWMPDRSTPYRSRDEWREDPKVIATIGADSPIGLYWRFALEEAMKFVELKALVGGVTTLQGLPLDGLREGWLLRHVERETRDGVPVAAGFVVKPAVDDPFLLLRSTMARSTAVIYHLAEGTDPRLGLEFDELLANGCIAPRFVGVHSTALSEEQLRRWASRGGTLVWSPLSNLWLYGATTDVATAHAARLRVCLGPDWSISGSKNLLGELKVADLWNRHQLSRTFSDIELCEMVTSNPADAVGLDDRIGRIRPSLRADILVLARRRDDPYRNLIEGTERDVSLVVADGIVRYGTPELVLRARAVNVAPIEVAGVSRLVSLPDPSVPSSSLSWEDIVATLERVHWAQQVRAFIPLISHEHLPALDTLAPDASYFDAIDRATIPGPALGGLRDYYL